MSIPNNDTILALLDRLAVQTADDLESDVLDFKPCTNAKDDCKVAVEYAVCFANTRGGVVVFGVADKTRGRAAAIHGCQTYDLDQWRRQIHDSTKPNITAEVDEIAVPEGTGKLIVVRVPRGEHPPYGTSAGMFKHRVGKNCVPLDPTSFHRSRVQSGALDWSGQPVLGISPADLDRVEIARARNVLRRIQPDSELLKLKDADFLIGIGGVRGGRVTHAGLLLFGQESTLREVCPQHQVHYVYQVEETSVARNDSFRTGLLQVLERIESSFTGSANPEVEVAVGLFKLRIPAFPIEVVREAVLNAVTHRDYSDPGEVMIRHTPRELVVTSPGGFLGGITPKNILRAEPVSRNRALAEAFEKLRLVERAGTGRRRIYVPLLSYGKRMPEYEESGGRVTLRIYNGGVDDRTAALVAKWRELGKDVDLDALILLNYLRENAFVDTITASDLLQLSRDAARSILDTLSLPRAGFLERKGSTRAATYHLSKGVAKELMGKAAYTKTKGLNPIRYREMVKAFVSDHGSITPQECRELLGLGESQTARVEVSRLLRGWSTGPEAFIRREGKGPGTRYRPV